MNFTILGSGTQQAVIYKSESHKLAHSLPVKAGEKVLPGQQVVINGDGTIQGFKAGDSLSRIIGMATISSETPAYKESKQYGVVETTVAVSGHGIINAVSGAALTAGPVKPTGDVVSNKYPKYINVDEEAGDRITAIALNEASAAGELIQVIIL